MTNMNRILLLVVLLSFFAVESMSAFEALHPHSDAGAPHAAQDDDCGCLCHWSADAVVVSDGIRDSRGRFLFPNTEDQFPS